MGDEKVFRIEFVGDEGASPSSSEPPRQPSAPSQPGQSHSDDFRTPAGASRRPTDDTFSDAQERDDRSRLEDDLRSREEQIERLIREGSDEPLPASAGVPSDSRRFAAGDQVTASQMFGEEAEAARLAIPDISAEDAELEELIRQLGMRSSSGSGGAAGRNVVAGAGGAAMAGATGAAGGGGGAAGGGGAGAGAAGAAGAAGLTAALTLVAGVAAGLAVILTMFSLAVVAATEVLSDMADRLISEFEPVSGQIAAARAIQEAQLIQHRMAVAPDASAVSVIEAQTGVQKELIELRTHVIRTIAPLLVALLSLTEKILSAINAVLGVLQEIVTLMMKFWRWVMDKLEEIPFIGILPGMMKRWLDRQLAMREGDTDDPGEEFQREVKDFLGNLEDRTSTGAFTPSRPRRQPRRGIR